MGDQPVVLEEDGESPPPERSSIDQERVRAMGVMVDELRNAAEAKDDERFRMLADRIFGREESGDTVIERPVAYSETRTSRLDFWRLWLTWMLVAGLIVIIVLAVWPGANVNAAPYISIFSGLVGIAVGWLFGANSRTGDPGTNK